MLFNSYLFIFCFLPIVWAIFHILKTLSTKTESKNSMVYMTLAKGFLVVASLIFYAYWKLIYLPILLGSIVVNYFIAKGIIRSFTNVDSGEGGGEINDFGSKSGDHHSVGLTTQSNSLNTKGLAELESNTNANKVKSTLTLESKLLDSSQMRSRALPSDNINDRSLDSSVLYRYKLSAKFLVTLGIIFNLFLLGVFKYTDFFLENFNLFSKLLALDFTIPLPHILLPLALSFVTFQQIAFLVDCYKQRMGFKGGVDSSTTQNLYKQAQDSRNQLSNINFLDYCLFITFFPQLIAGPIVHHKEMMPQFYKMSRKSQESCLDSNCKAFPPQANKIINWEYIAKGLFIFSIGLFKKVVIADSFAKWANTGFSAVENGAVLNCLESWVVSLSYTFQLYFDFSGYCDMAIGLGLLFGIVLPINFDSPYKAANIATFWRKWHITLGRFLKHYVYIPLGGNQNIKCIGFGEKSSKLASTLNNLLTLRNLFIVAFLSGVWHGAGWGFVIWGSLHGIAMVVHRIYVLLYKRLDSLVRNLAKDKGLIYLLLPRLRTPSARVCEHSQDKPFSSAILESKTNLHKLTENRGYIRFIRSRIYMLLCWILTFNFINIAWVFFRAENVQGAINLLQGMFCGEVVLPKSLESKLGVLSEWGVEFGAMWIANVVKFESSIFAGIFLAAGFVITLFLRNSFEIASNLRLRVYNATFCAILLAVSLLFIGGNDYSAFLYFNF